MIKKHNSDWLLNEINAIKYERLRSKKKSFFKNSDTKQFFIIMLLLVPLFFLALNANADITCPTCNQNLHIVVEASRSASWRCNGCKRFVYSEESDWRGDFYCNNCGKRKGDE